MILALLLYLFSLRYTMLNKKIEAAVDPNTLVIIIILLKNQNILDKSTQRGNHVAPYTIDKINAAIHILS
jgi:hypothetical protein